MTDKGNWLVFVEMDVFLPLFFVSGSKVSWFEGPDFDDLGIFT